MFACVCVVESHSIRMELEVEMDSFHSPVRLCPFLCLSSAFTSPSNISICLQAADACVICIMPDNVY